MRRYVLTRLAVAVPMLVVATLYPWYLLSLLPFAALCRHRAWLALEAAPRLLVIFLTRRGEGVDGLFAYTQGSIWREFAADQGALLRGAAARDCREGDDDQTEVDSETLHDSLSLACRHPRRATGGEPRPRV